MINYLLNFTNRCNLQCRHCYAGCGPAGKTMPEEDIEKVLAHAPKNTEFFHISGGEPLMERKRLEQMLEFVGKNRQEIMPKAEIVILTNGFWIPETGAYGILKNLFAGGVNVIDIASNDKFHKEQGLDANELREPLYDLLARLAAETGNNLLGNTPLLQNNDRQTNLYLNKGKKDLLRVVIRGYSEAAYSIGRGNGLNANDIRKYSSCKIHERGLGGAFDITVAPDGLVYPCCWRVTPPIGSALEKPVDELIAEMKENKIFNALMTGGIIAVAKMSGAYEKRDLNEYISNPCVKCEEIFRGLR